MEAKLGREAPGWRKPSDKRGGEDEEAVQRGRAEFTSAVAEHLAWLRAAVVCRDGAAEDVLDRHRRARADRWARAEALRRRTERFNLTVPIASRQGLDDASESEAGSSRARMCLAARLNVNADRVVAEAEEAAAPLLAALGPGGRGPGGGKAAICREVGIQWVRVLHSRCIWTKDARTGRRRIP